LYSVKILFLFFYIGKEFKVNKTAKKNIKCKSFLRVFFGFGERPLHIEGGNKH
jgi:hypothetical protein